MALTTREKELMRLAGEVTSLTNYNGDFHYSTRYVAAKNPEYAAELFEAYDIVAGNLAKADES
jgi:hypothetical protein